MHQLQSHSIYFKPLHYFSFAVTNQIIGSTRVLLFQHFQSQEFSIAAYLHFKFEPISFEVLFLSYSIIELAVSNPKSYCLSFKFVM